MFQGLDERKAMKGKREMEMEMEMEELTSALQPIPS
jgi:hypothetical protein